MARKKIDLRRVKPTKRYTVRELAETLNITPRAIYWDIHVDDLPYLTIKGVTRIVGEEFIEFTKERRKKHKRKDTKSGDFLCFNCNTPFVPLNRQVVIDNKHLNQTQIRNGVIMLRGICPRCRRNMYQTHSMSELDKLKGLYNIVNDLMPLECTA